MNKAVIVSYLSVIMCLIGSGALAGEIHTAAAHGDIARIEQMLSADPSLLNAPDETGATPLHWAVDREKAAIVECLLSHKADVNARKKNGVTPLQIAAGSGCIGIVRQLIANGADVNAKDDYGRTALSIARGRGRNAVVSLLAPLSNAVPEEKRAGVPVNHVWTRVRGCPVNLVYINLDDPEVTLDAAVAQQGIGHSESFGSFVKRLKPTAAINGTFFGIRNQTPVGDIVIGGRLVHFGGMGTGVCISADKKASFISVQRGRHRDWSAYKTVVCGGPRLVRNGIVEVNARAEGFRDSRVLGHAGRTAIGVTDRNRLVFLTTRKNCSLVELANILRDIGCVDAMNLDGGSSSAMYYRGKMVTTPKRRLTNVLVVYDHSNASSPGKP